MTETGDIEKRTLTIKRTFDAPRQLAWDAWTQPGHIANWWGPPGMKVNIKAHDFRVGGEWKYTMDMPDGNEFITFGVYSRIVEPELLETSANFIPMTEGVIMIAQFLEAGDKTEFVFKVIHPTEEYCRQQEDMGFFNGWGSSFKRLNEYLSSL